MRPSLSDIKPSIKEERTLPTQGSVEDKTLEATGVRMGIEPKHYHAAMLDGLRKYGGWVLKPCACGVSKKIVVHPNSDEWKHSPVLCDKKCAQALPEHVNVVID